MNEPAANPSLIPSPGTLYVVATPIGNLADLTERARAILGAVDLVACEDTRTTGGLLTRFGLHRPLVSYHDHNETEAAEFIAAKIAAGQSVALVSDAGTPAISDPGFRLVRACRRRGLPVIPIPGACAVAAVLSASGLPTNGFLFAGFLIAKTSARTAFLENSPSRSTKVATASINLPRKSWRNSDPIASFASPVKSPSSTRPGSLVARAMCASVCSKAA